MRAHLRAGFTGEHVRVVVMHVLHEAAVDSEHAEGLQLVVAQHRAVVTQDQLGVAVAASNYYNHDITIFADASNISTQARVLPGYFASSGFHGAFIEVAYVERSLTRWV